LLPTLCNPSIAIRKIAWTILMNTPPRIPRSPTSHIQHFCPRLTIMSNPRIFSSNRLLYWYPLNLNNQWLPPLTEQRAHPPMHGGTKTIMNMRPATKFKRLNGSSYIDHITWKRVNQLIDKGHAFSKRLQHNHLS